MTQRLKRETGLGGAMIIGLGSILGTGAYVSIGLSASIASETLVLAIIIASVTALCNGLSSAQLASAHPVSGGTYEYGYQFLNPSCGVLAGVLFLIAKSASAATAALGIAWYSSDKLGVGGASVNAIAIGLLLLFTIFVLAGVKRTNWLNVVLVTISLLGLAVFVSLAFSQQPAYDANDVSTSSSSLLYAAALMFVAFTGYGRIATMGEEIKDPRKNIPRAVVITLAVITIIYLAVGMAILHVSNPQELSRSDFNIARLLEDNPFQVVIVVGGMTAMCGVVINLILGVSRVFMAMGRRRDLPEQLSVLDEAGNSAPTATWTTFLLMSLIVMVGSIQLTWAFSAFTVLIYYGLTNLAALRVPQKDRFIPKFVSVIGLLSCIGLAAFIPLSVVISGSITAAALVGLSYLYRNWRSNER